MPEPHLCDLSKVAARNDRPGFEVATAAVGDQAELVFEASPFFSLDQVEIDKHFSFL